MHGPLGKQLLNFSPRLHLSILISLLCMYICMYVCMYVSMYVCIDRYRHTACVGLMWVQRRRCWTSIGPASDRHLTFDALPVLFILTVHKHYMACTCRWPSRLRFFLLLLGVSRHATPPPSSSPAFAPIVD